MELVDDHTQTSPRVSTEDTDPTSTQITQLAERDVGLAVHVRAGQ
jgi:hypothetical protein